MPPPASAITSSQAGGRGEHARVEAGRSARTADEVDELADRRGATRTHDRVLPAERRDAVERAPATVARSPVPISRTTKSSRPYCRSGGE